MEIANCLQRSSETLQVQLNVLNSRNLGLFTVTKLSCYKHDMEYKVSIDSTPTLCGSWRDKPLIRRIYNSLAE